MKPRSELDVDINVSDDGLHLVVRIVGEVTRERARVFAGMAQTEAARLGLWRFLFDLRRARNVDDAAGNYYYAYEDLQRIGRPREARSALLVAPDDSSHDFVETSIRNAGYNVRLFREEGAALAWLTEA